MGLHYILGSSGAGKTYELYNYVIEESIKHPEQEYLFIVPEQFTLQTQKDFASLHPMQGIMNIDVLSLLRLAFRVFEETRADDRIILEDTGKSMIVKKVMLEKRNDLNVFSGNIKKRGFIEEMKSVISELYQYAIGEEEYEQMLMVSKSKPLLHAKLMDIKIIYDAFGDFLKDKYITNEEIFEVLGEELKSSSLIKKSIVCLDGFTGFTPSQYKLIRKIIRYAKDVYVTVTIDEASYKEKQQEHQLFYNSYFTIQKLNKIASVEKKDIEARFINNHDIPYRYKASKPLAHLEQNIFRYPYDIYMKEQDDISIYAANDREDECERTALNIRRLVKEEGFRYKDIAVISADVSGYGIMLRKKLTRLSIPCFVDEKESILSNPLAELIRALLAVIRYDYTYDSVMHLLKTGLLDWELEEVDKLENYIIALGIRGRNRFKHEWKKRYRSAYNISINEINQYRQKFINMTEPVTEVFMNKESKVRDYLAAIYNFFREQTIEEKLITFAEETKSYEDVESRILAKEYEQVYRLVIEVFDRVAALLGEDILPIDEFCEIIETGLSEARVGLIPPGTDQVVIGDIERTRLKDIKALFFLGVNDGLVPKAGSSGGILSDIDRQFFAENMIELAPTIRQNAYTTDFYLYLSLTKPQNKLYLSYYKQDTDGRAAYPSSLLSKIISMFKEIKLSEKKEIILGTDKGLTYLADSLRRYVHFGKSNKEQSQSEHLHNEELQNEELQNENTKNEQGENYLTDFFYELYKLYLNDTQGNIEINKLIGAAFYERKESGISKKAAIMLYGSTLLGSVTRMEQYASCAFAHYLSYGLSLEEREEYEISMPDIGNIYHAALEYFSNKLKEEGYTFHDLLEEDRLRIGRDSVIAACTEYNNNILSSSKRNAYIVKKVERVLHRTTKTIKEQLSSGKFEPFAYERVFLYSDKYLSLRGRIDRIDFYENEDKLYVQIVDYKSGSQKFDLESLYYGLQLQLGVYLQAGLNIVKDEVKSTADISKANSTASDQTIFKDIVPAGVFYYNIDDPIVEKSREVEEEISKKLMLNGLANSGSEALTALDMKFADENGRLKPMVKSTVIPAETNKEGQLSKKSSIASDSQFTDLLEFINNKMHKMSSEIMSGDTNLNPYKNNDITACKYCAYSSICGFDIRLPGNAYNKLKKMSEDEIWKEMTGGRDGLD